MNTDLTTYNPKKILVCQQQQIGDVVISTAMVELLAKHYPEAEIHFLTEKKCAPILENNPHIAKVWPIDKSKNFLASAAFSRTVARQKYDLLIDFQQLPRCRQVAMFSRAKVKLTYETKWYKRFFYTHFASTHGKGGYAGQAKARMLTPLGIEWNIQPPRMYLSNVEQKWAAQYLTEQGFTPEDTLVAMDTTHWSDTRRWPARHYATFIGQALNARPNLRFYLFHGPGERDQVEEVVRLAGHEDRCILPPKTMPCLRQTAAIIDRAAIQVGNCSAPRHMAVALNTPTLTIIGSNGDTAWTFPDKSRHRIAFHHLPCSKCNRNTCEKDIIECLVDLLPKNVTQIFASMLTDLSLPNHPVSQ